MRATLATGKNVLSKRYNISACMQVYVWGANMSGYNGQSA